MVGLPKKDASDTMPGSPVSPPILSPLSTLPPHISGRRHLREDKSRSLAEILMDDGVETPPPSTLLPPSRGQKHLTWGKLTEILMDDGEEKIETSDIEMSSSSETDTRDVVTVNCRRAGFKSMILQESIELKVTQGSRLQDVWFEVCGGSSRLRSIGYKKLSKEVDVCNDRAKIREVFHIEHFVRDLPAGFNKLTFIVEENQRTREAIIRGAVPVCSSAPLPQISDARSKCVSHSLSRPPDQGSRRRSAFSRDPTSSTSTFRSSQREGGNPSSRPAYPYRFESNREAFSHGKLRSQQEADFFAQVPDQPFRRRNDSRSIYDPPYVGHQPGQNFHYCEPFADSIQDHMPACFLDGNRVFRDSPTLPMHIPLSEEDLRMQQADRQPMSFIRSQERYSFLDHTSRLAY